MAKAISIKRFPQMNAMGFFIGHGPGGPNDQITEDWLRLHEEIITRERRYVNRIEYLNNIEYNEEGHRIR